MGDTMLRVKSGIAWQAGIRSEFKLNTSVPERPLLGTLERFRAANFL